MLAEISLHAKRFLRPRDKRSLPEILCVVDGSGWVQEARIRCLARYLAEYEFLLMTAKQFASLWDRGKLRQRKIYFASWRIPYSLTSAEGLSFEESDYRNFMASVTSHYNIGGGLNPTKALAKGTTQQEALAAAVALLRKFKVVTVNSKILYQLLSPYLAHIIYAPNGVDASFFSPASRREYDPDHIKIGWVGKIKAAKNYEVLEKTFHELENEGFDVYTVAFAKDVRKGKFFSKTQMRDFYQKIDYYLCTSWHEGTPNPALEAAACGVPVVTTRVGNMPELIQHGHSGFFIDPTFDSIMELFSEIKKLSTTEYNQLRSTIRNQILEDWLWDKNVDNYRIAFECLFKAGEGGETGKDANETAMV